jgi:hypothetical protein
VEENFIEFIFEGINLPFDDDNNDGFVLFKIKTASDLIVGDSFDNSAAIYFDYNFPVMTNDAITTVEKPLSVVDFNLDKIRLFPNPANNQLIVSGLDSNELKSLQVYSLHGQLLINQESNTTSIEVTNLQEGVYFLKISTTKGVSFKRFVKE